MISIQPKQFLVSGMVDGLRFTNCAPIVAESTRSMRMKRISVLTNQRLPALIRLTVHGTPFCKVVRINFPPIFLSSTKPSMQYGRREWWIIGILKVIRISKKLKVMMWIAENFCRYVVCNLAKFWMTGMQFLTFDHYFSYSWTWRLPFPTKSDEFIHLETIYMLRANTALKRNLECLIWRRIHGTKRERL